nr:hypothetical protein [Paenibacillus swuensis]
MCPVCNGLEVLQAACGSCGSLAQDCGKYNDYIGPYEPYRQIEDLKLTNGWIDYSQGTCVHVTYCSQCGGIADSAVQEWTL